MKQPRLANGRSKLALEQLSWIKPLSDFSSADLPAINTYLDLLEQIDKLRFAPATRSVSVPGSAPTSDFRLARVARAAQTGAADAMQARPRQVKNETSAASQANAADVWYVANGHRQILADVGTNLFGLSRAGFLEERLPAVIVERIDKIAISNPRVWVELFRLANARGSGVDHDCSVRQLSDDLSRLCLAVSKQVQNYLRSAVEETRFHPDPTAAQISAGADIAQEAEEFAPGSRTSAEANEVISSCHWFQEAFFRLAQSCRFDNYFELRRSAALIGSFGVEDYAESKRSTDSVRSGFLDFFTQKNQENPEVRDYQVFLFLNAIADQANLSSWSQERQLDLFEKKILDKEEILVATLSCLSERARARAKSKKPPPLKIDRRLIEIDTSALQSKLARACPRA